MPVATTTQAGRDQHAAHVARMAEAKAKAEQAARELNQPSVVGRVSLATIPDAPLFSDSEPVAAPALEAKRRPITMQISAVLDGFTVAITFDGMLTQLPGAIERLKALGATPTSSAPIADPVGWQTLPDGTPICPKHRTPMRKRERQGDTWYSHGVGKGPDGKDLFCKGYHGKDSPGYEVD